MCLRHVSALRAHSGAGIYIRVLSTTFAKGEYIAISHREIISHLRSKYIAHRRCISRERSELKRSKYYVYTSSNKDYTKNY